MSQKFHPDNSLSPKELAKQLTKPEGETGKAIGLHMNEGNKHITLNSYRILKPQAGDSILEIGMGNGYYIKDLLAAASGLKYTGVDYSEIMVEETGNFNKEALARNQVQIIHASIEKLPFNKNTFDSIVTTNTIYFWPNEIENAKELLRVLKPGGKLCIAYRSKEFLEMLPMTKFGFKKFIAKDVEQILKQAGFLKIYTEVMKEPEVDYNGTTIQMIGHFTYGIKANMKH